MSGDDGPWTRRAQGADAWLARNKIVVSATTASLVSTFCGFPLDSLKSRLQSSRENLSIPRLAAEVVKEEGIGGLWRGFPLPLITISIVRTISFTIYTSTKRIINSRPGDPEPKRPWLDLHLGILNKDTALDVGTTSFLAGAASGAVVCIGSAPFELVKVRRQLEYQIYRDSHPVAFSPTADAAAGLRPVPSGADAVAANARLPQPRTPFVPPTTLQAVRMIVNKMGPLGLWTGFRLHFVRDTLGTALYFAEYDVMRFWLGRRVSDPASLSAAEDRLSGGQGELPDWAKGWLPKQLVPFLCGSLAGVTSWAIIYPVDAMKTKAQQRALSGLRPRTPLVQFLRLVRGTEGRPKPLLTGIARLYRGLGVSMIRSMLTHGLLWTLVDWTSAWIDTKPVERLTKLA
ncbi:hypothetical protein Q8F55_007188 [Vanrija albida]|uniref:Mitochondrial carrier n=1 Tax=Vanrija albida TaxID=181172 RepID=A0ABR3PZ28_9TREE